MADTRLEPVLLSDDERRTLENWVKRRSAAQGLAQRARIVLACAGGGSNAAVAARLRVHRGTVARWRRRFLEQRLDGLAGEPRPGVPRSITGAQVEDVVVRTLEEVPAGSTHWPKRELAGKTGMPATSVQQIWRAFGLQPWRTETFKISPGPLLVPKIRDVAGLYLNPPRNAVVFSVDEKPQIQALERTAPVPPMLPGVPGRRSFGYERHGTTDLLAALNIATGKVISKLSAQHTAIGFRDFLDQIDQAVEPGLDVHVICGNLSTHKAPGADVGLAGVDRQAHALGRCPDPGGEDGPADEDQPGAAAGEQADGDEGLHDGHGEAEGVAVVQGHVVPEIDPPVDDGRVDLGQVVGELRLEGLGTEGRHPLVGRIDGPTTPNTLRTSDYGYAVPKGNLDDAAQDLHGEDAAEFTSIRYETVHPVVRVHPAGGGR